MIDAIYQVEKVRNTKTERRNTKGRLKERGSNIWKGSKTVKQLNFISGGGSGGELNDRKMNLKRTLKGIHKK